MEPYLRYEIVNCVYFAPPNGLFERECPRGNNIMEKMYQVFISSTFEDLQEERLKILNTLLSFSCIPAGMELFSAASEEQFEYIKKVIDQVDYYILIVAGRYGSIAKDGKSYTEKEFDYAKKSGIPILAFLHNNPENLPSKYTEQTDIGKAKLMKFKEKVCKDRMVAFWDNSDELATKIIAGLQEEIYHHPQNGWVRAENTGISVTRKTNSQYSGSSLSSKTLYTLYRKRIINLSKQIKRLRKPHEESNDLINITEDSVEELAKACYHYFTKEHTGSLIAIEQITPLDEFIQTGIEIDALISSQLLVSIFEHNMPLHDGAVVIRDNRIIASSCYLVCSDNPKYWNVGYRYRAGIGVSEVSDCIVIITSSETGNVSIAHAGELYEGLREERFVKMIKRLCRK